MTILGLFVFLIVIGVVYWGAKALMGAFGVGDPIRTVVIVLLVVLILVAFLETIGATHLGLRLY